MCMGLCRPRALRVEYGTPPLISPETLGGFLKASAPGLPTGTRATKVTACLLHAPASLHRAPTV